VVASPQLLIGPDGTATTQSGVAIQGTGGPISVDDIRSTRSGSAAITATIPGESQASGAATFTNQIAGTATFNSTGSYAAGTITNESNRSSDKARVFI
jgi:hypothetical protein